MLRPPTHPLEAGLAGPLNARIAERMHELSLATLKDFARRCGLPLGELYLLVVSPTPPATLTVRTLITLAGALAVPTHELLANLYPEATA